MALEKQPFRQYNTEGKKADVVTIWLSPEERLQLEEWKKLIQQEKDGTTFKQLASIGAKLLGEEKTRAILEVVLNNYRKNKKRGVVTFE